MVTCSHNADLPETGKAILLIDDHPLSLESLQHCLQFLGYQTLTARNGREALTLYTEHKNSINLIITDSHLPEMDGMTLISTIRAQGTSLPVLIFSGILDFQVQALDKQPKSYVLRKPCGILQFSQIIQEILAEKQNNIDCLDDMLWK